MPPKRKATEEAGAATKKAKATPKTAAAKPAPKAPAKKAAPKKAASKKKAAEPEDIENEEPEDDESSEEEPAPVKKAAPKKAAPKKAVPDKAAPKTAPKKAVAEKPVEKKPATKKAAPKEEAKPKPAPKAKAAPKQAPVKAAKPLPVINEVPTRRLDIYVFGEGSNGELGLGSKNAKGKSVIDVKRPRLNDLLSAKDVGVVQIAVGGMHCAAITHDNKILTWGVNDQGALGRDTEWAEEKLKDADADEDDDSSDSDSDDSDSGMNPRESTPGEVEMHYFPQDIKFVQVVASDSATFVVTSEGSVWGWGTFRGNEGIIGFTSDIEIQRRPMQIVQLKKIVTLAAGANHILALDNKGHVFAWGSGQQNQLGRRVVERTRSGGLVPREFGLPRGKVVSVSCGSYHSFAMDTTGRVWAWGLNNFAETGIAEGAGDDNAIIPNPAIVKSLSKYKIKQIDGGGHHSLAATEDGQLLSWGRVDGHQIGITTDKLPEDAIIRDDRGIPRILNRPVVVPGIKAVMVAAGSENSFAIDADGKVWSWGFSGNYQTGQGTDEDIKEATVIDNAATRDKKLVWAGAGGQFSVLAAYAN